VEKGLAAGITACASKNLPGELHLTSLEAGDIETQVLVIGAGAAGCAAALAAAGAGLDVVMLTKSRDLSESATAAAQGGIIGRGPDDSAEALVRDILAAGDGLSEPSAAHLLATEGVALVESLLIKRLAVDFTRGADGQLDFAQEAAHSARRILHSDDATGRAIHSRLTHAVAAQRRIQPLPGRTAVDLITIPHHSTDPLDLYAEPECLGAYVHDISTGRVSRVFAHHTLLACGALGQVYLHTTNPKVSTGDGVAMAARAGASIINMEYVQFHPTALYHRDAERFLVTEALRGEGARLRTRDGRFFMSDYHPLADLAPRDVVARAIHQEMLNRGDEYVLLDLTDLRVDPKERFPTVYETCSRFGIDITHQAIPVVPAAHYCCGGVRVDEWGRTSLGRLYAAGEVACTGVHGANRLASTSLVEALLWGTRAVQDIDREREQLGKPNFDHIPPWHDAGLTEETDPALVIQDWTTIKSTMWNYAGIVRSEKRLNRACADLEYLQHRIEQFYRETRLTSHLISLRNGIQVALLIAHAARRNPTSRGCHFRLD
jgi:L-aspartate oxidase